MTVHELIPDGYALTVTAAERDQLLLACEVAIASKRAEPERWRLLPDVDADALDSLADTLLLNATEVVS